MNVAFIITPANLIEVVNRLQPNFVNDNRRIRDRFEEPIVVPRNGNRNQVDLSSFESEKEAEDDRQAKINIVLQRVLLL